MEIKLPDSTPTSVLFFIGTAVAVFFTPDHPFLRWFAYSSFVFFLVLGPIPFIGQLFTYLPIKRSGQWTSIDEDDGPCVAALMWSYWIFQSCLTVVAVVLAYHGIRVALS